MAASNGFVYNGGFDDSEDKSMLLMKNNGNDGHGITALINRQLQGNYFCLLVQKLNGLHVGLLDGSVLYNCYNIVK